MAAPIPGLDPAWIALIGTICGGIGLKFAEKWLGRSKERSDDAMQIRDELRLEIAKNREEIKELEIEVEKWRKEYYDLRDLHIKLQTEMSIALDRIKADKPLDPPATP